MGVLMTTVCEKEGQRIYAVLGQDAPAAE